MQARVLVVDNYDSFVFNLVQYLGQLGADPVVLRNDSIAVSEVGALGIHGIVVSPGPGRPEGAGISTELIRHFAGVVPILGVCLGHQAIGQVFGASVVRASSVMHGKVSSVAHDGRGLFAGLDSPFDATRYHSLVVDPGTVPAELEVSAWTAEGTIMGLRHRHYPIDGVQFHPESILTKGGVDLVQNWLDSCAGAGRAGGAGAGGETAGDADAGRLETPVS